MSWDREHGNEREQKGAGVELGKWGKGFEAGVGLGRWGKGWFLFLHMVRGV